uniref:Oxysterol-binding protein n=1 Tax=Fundulus heteroclitus TaxID=8078 RepID=A0A3Q2PR57_FUNHE
MDPQVSSSQSVITCPDKSPASTFKPSHSRNNSTAVFHLLIFTQRYFLLERGILKYSKTQQDVQKGKLHGSLDINAPLKHLTKISIFKLHVKNGCSQSSDIFYIWLTKLAAHRLYRKNEAMSVHRGVLQALSLSQKVTSTTPLSSYSGVNNKVSAWLQQTHNIDATSNELARSQAELTELVQLVQRLHWLEGGIPITNTDLEMRISMQNLFLEKPKKKSGKVGHSRTLSRVEAMGGMFTSSHLSTNNSSNLGASVQSIPDYVYSQLSNPQVTSPEAKKLHQDICTLSQRVHMSLKSIHEVLTLERERLRQAWTSPDLRQNASQQLATLCTTLSELDMQSHLTKVHSISLSSGSTEESFCTVCTEQRTSLNRHSHRAPSVADSIAEYFDAHEVIVCETSSDAEASDESGLSDITTTSNSEPEEGHSTATLNYRESLNSATDKPNLVPSDTGRRTTLPSPGAENKLEYSDLLDIANNTDDPYQRMVYVAAFSISGYAWASWRNRYKPFNPVLGETYENHREDRGFYYISEQVSHHPPISACHAESENFTFWQDQRWKYKFWGKSVEIISSGLVNVSLPKYGDHYQWNKAVTCIHNVLSQQRWLEHYGEVVIRNTKSDVCTCKMTFVKSRYWSSESSKNEIQGVVLDQAGEVVHRFGGFWHEGVFCDTLATPTCIWKPNVQPDDHFQFYGFSHYARELNELSADLKAVLPPTDTRFRPDQRLLEEGKVAEADKKKDEVEEKQRERRKEMDKRGEEHVPRFFRKVLDEAGREVWTYNGTYWKIRQAPGFSKTENLALW